MTPDKYTLQEHFLDVGDGHQLYVHDWGNKKVGTPIVFLHGGPGSHVQDKYKGAFDPDRERVVFFDQRGCGKSLPYGSLEHNTTKDLIEDIEKIAVFLKLDQFVITGGSWGSCLALAFALKYPKRVSAMVLHGIFTGSQAEIDWLEKGGMKMFFPDRWDDFLSVTPKSYQQDPGMYHFKRILSEDENQVKESGFAYENLEGSVMSLDDRFTPDNLDEYDPAGIRMETLYMANRCFMEDRLILNNAHKLSMPIWLVQGRYDMVCPPITAYELHQKLPNSQLIWTVSGHRSERETWNLVRTILLQVTS